MRGIISAHQKSTQQTKENGRQNGVTQQTVKIQRSSCSKRQRLQQMPLLQSGGTSAEKLLHSHSEQRTNGGQTGPSFPIKRRANWGAATAVPEPTAAVPRTNDANAAAATTTAIWPGQPVPSPSL